MTPRRPVQKLFRIGEVAEYSGLSRQTVNYYTMLGILHETRRTKAGHRLYDESVFDRIDRVRALKSKHTLREIAGILRKEDSKSEEPKSGNGATN
jgi:DNA-binding transcriptional MerR regulator